MDKLLIISLFFLGGACSSLSNKAGERSIASAGKCTVVQHPTKDLYQIEINGKAYNPHWYDEEYAVNLQERLYRSGKCK